MNAAWMSLEAVASALLTTTITPEATAKAMTITAQRIEERTDLDLVMGAVLHLGHSSAWSGLGSCASFGAFWPADRNVISTARFARRSSIGWARGRLTGRMGRQFRYGQEPRLVRYAPRTRARPATL